MKQMTIFDVFEEVPEVKSPDVPEVKKHPAIAIKVGKEYVLNFPTQHLYDLPGDVTVVKLDLENKKAYCDIRTIYDGSAKPFRYSRVITFDDFYEYMDVERTLWLLDWNEEQERRRKQYENKYR